MRQVLAWFFVMTAPAFADGIQSSHFSDPDVCYVGQPTGDGQITQITIGRDFRIPDDQNAGRLAVGTTNTDGAFYISYATCRPTTQGSFCVAEEGGAFHLLAPSPTTLQLMVSDAGLVGMGRFESILYEQNGPDAQHSLSRGVAEDCPS
jgi:hypothetical protein